MSVEDPFGFRTYPSFRDIKLKSVEKWLEGKRADDASEPGLWRVHDRLYDLKEFVNRHPGGADWIRATQGTFTASCESVCGPYYKKWAQVLPGR